MATVGETVKTTVTQEGIKALISWIFSWPPVLAGLFGAAVSAALYVYGSMAPWAIGLLLATATFVMVLFACKLPALYRVLSHRASDGWRYAKTVHLIQAACLLEDIEPQAPLPKRAVV